MEWRMPIATLLHAQLYFTTSYLSWEPLFLLSLLAVSYAQSGDPKDPCGNGEYYLMAFDACGVCPANSVVGESGLSRCPCVEGHYRAGGEDHLACTRESTESDSPVSGN